MDIGGVTFGGLASGLDTRALIDAILQAERRPIERLQQREGLLNAKKSALGEMRSKLSGFLSTLKGLRTQGTFNGRVTTVSDETAFRASAAPGAERGLFSIDILELASAHKVKSDGFAASDQGLVDDGTITIQSGSNDAITIEVDSASGNNTLQAVRDAINDADAGVQASILFDGSDYRLIVRAEESGVDNALSISDGTNLDLDDGGNVVQVANDARITVDSIEVTGSSNRISGAIQGVTLDLLTTTDETGPVTVEVADDIDGVVAAVQELADSYNEAMKFLSGQLDLSDPGPLANDSFARRMQLTLQSLMTAGAEGIPFGEIRSLASIGVSFDGRSGELSVDSSELRELLEERFDDIGRMFEATGTAADARIQFVSGTSSTVSGEYAVEINAAAEQASVVGTPMDPSKGLKKAETLTIAVGSDTIDVDLAKDLKIDAIVEQINSALGVAEIAATAVRDGDSIRISTDAYGSDQTVTVTSDLANPGNGRQTGFDLTPTTDSGQDVAGKIGGVDATGVGQLLTAAEDGPYAGLTVRVTATAADIVATGGDFGTVAYSGGLASRLIGELTEVTRFGDGQIDSSQDVIADQLKRISDEVARWEERLVAREARLVKTFAAAEQAIALLQSQEDRLQSFF